MKQVRFLGMMAMMLCALLVGFTSCSDDDDDAPDKFDAKMLEGLWQGVTYDGWERENGEIIWESNGSVDYSGYVLCFYDDGTCIDAEWNGEDWIWKDYESTSWKLEDNKIFLTSKEESGSETSISNVLELTDTKLVLENFGSGIYDGVECEWYSKVTYNKVID